MIRTILLLVLFCLTLAEASAATRDPGEHFSINLWGFQ